MPATLLDRLEPLLMSARQRGVPTLVSATVRVPDVDAISLFATSPGASIWLQPSAGVALVGIGEAWSVAARGPGRFDQVSRAWRGLLDGAMLDPAAGTRAAGPRLLGGFAFLDDPAATPAWHGFGSASLVLPKLLLSQDPEGARLTLSLVVEPGRASRPAAERLLATWVALVDVAAAPEQPRALARLQVESRIPEADHWRDTVARLAGAVGRGRLDKVVLSRRVVLQAPEPLIVPDALRRLVDSATESTIFAIRRGSTTFLGASPERLVSVRGRDIETMAMAGSTQRTGDQATDDEFAARLLESDKEREEHAVVVAMLREALLPLASELHIPSRPLVERFRHVQHLVTPISGRLRADADVLELVARLHPTPAVGGAPRDLALELIAEEEPDDRGWYSGPVGWIDRHGDGEFAVALRSGLVSGETAILFAGCGIVADSDPEMEWRESATKLLALGSALGRVEA